MLDRSLFTRWASIALLACLFTTALPHPIVAQSSNKSEQRNPDIQAADRELETISKQSFELPLFTQKSKLQTIYQRYEKYNHKPGLDLTRLELAWIAYQDADYAEADRQLRPIENSFNPSMSAYWRSKSLRGLLQLEAGKPREALQNLLR